MTLYLYSCNFCFLRVYYKFTWNQTNFKYDHEATYAFNNDNNNNEFSLCQE